MIISFTTRYVEQVDSIVLRFAAEDAAALGRSVGQAEAKQTDTRGCFDRGEATTGVNRSESSASRRYAEWNCLVGTPGRVPSLIRPLAGRRSARSFLAWGRMRMSSASGSGAQEGVSPAMGTCLFSATALSTRTRTTGLLLRKGSSTARVCSTKGRDSTGSRPF